MNIEELGALCGEVGGKLMAPNLNRVYYHFTAFNGLDYHEDAYPHMLAFAEQVPALLARLDAYAALEQAAAELLEDGQLIAPHGEAVVLETALYDRLDAALAALRATAAAGAT